ncbi:uncharacterized protein F4812DRAFT_408366 [Daldinia caldariorum]|uniref:uncharacterized protein n=1 Tax=Daldinia caldariorum TaxID=326644 RepID=UPI002008BA60|nr:uncharacterized protein F4812DRAFT_408366 [Daldinia caldariorum]KAI1472314.1 hypothetical protein F4812DRAFT_408366 [Daldinia caldariorum]
MTYTVSLSSTHSKRRKTHHNQLITTDAMTNNTRLLFDNLSTELLHIIFKHLRDVDPRTLADARQLSRRLEAVIRPIYFETIRLNENIVDPLAETYFPGYLEDLYLFTRHVETRSNLDAQNTKRVLDRVQRLCSLRWRYVGNRSFINSSFAFSTPSNILSPYHLKIDRTKIYVEDLPLQDIYTGSYNNYAQDIPASNLVSLKMQSPTLAETVESLKQFLVRAQGTRTISYNGRGQGTSFSFRGNERLPPFEEILLRSYDWNHDADEVQRHWNFSQLRKLTLIDVPLYHFLTSVPFAELSDLETLHCEDFSTHTPDRREDATRDLHRLVQGIKALCTITITCHTNLFPIDAFLRHTDSLQALSFRDYVGFGDETKQYPTMQIQDLNQLSTTLAYLNFLELGMDATVCDPNLFLQALCNFPRLTKLVLHTHTAWRAHDEVKDNTDRDYDAALRTLSVLTQNKRGKPWQSVVINVGGWKPVVVRRLSQAWQEKNARGIYAERCFDAKRDEDTGSYVLGEIPATDNTSV